MRFGLKRLMWGRNVKSGWSRWVLCGWGSSGGEPRGLAAVLASLRSFGGERGRMAAFLFL